MADDEANPVLTTTFLCGTAWEFGPADNEAVLGVMRFVPGGRIFGYEHPNERRWAFDGVLRLFSEQGVCTSCFDQVERAGDTIILQSKIRLGDEERCFRLQPRKMLHRFDQNLEALYVKERLLDLRRPLLVLFNSGGNPFSGSSVAWEYLLTTTEPSVDYVRMAERLEPSSWYLKTAEKIKGRICAAALGRRKVVFAGASSGGYAAIRFAEWLAGQGIVEEVAAIAVNPQTVHSLPHRQFLWAQRWDYFLPPSIEDETLEFLAVKDVDLDQLIGRDRQYSAEHVIYYDCENPAETYHATRLQGRPGVALKPRPLGLPHQLGIQQMERSGLLHKAIVAALAS